MFATSASFIIPGLQMMALGILFFLPCTTARTLRPVRDLHGAPTTDETDSSPEKTPCELFSDMHTLTIRLALNVNNTHAALVETYGGTAALAGTFGYGFTLTGLDTALLMPYRNWTKPEYLDECRLSQGNGTCPPPLNITNEEIVHRLHADLSTFRAYLQEVRDDEARQAEEHGSVSALLPVMTVTTSRLESLLTNIRITVEAVGFAILDDASADFMTSAEKDPVGELLRRSRDQQVIWQFLWYLRWAARDVTWLKHRHCQQ